ncbi:MAG: hypothetical protein P4L84_24165 [Isosphaeraceae bacterium]|nr:hypothetical protein [Isosphaeraceae bacterium]
MRRFLPSSARFAAGLAWLPVIALSLGHGLAIWIGLGGWQGLTDGWPLTQNDHPQHFHNAVIARPLFRVTGTNAGYDPAFMAGYAKSILSDSSSTASDIFVGLFGLGDPVLAYKLYILIAGAAVPWLVAGAGLLWRLGPGAIGLAVFFYTATIWSVPLIGYLELGMVAFFLAIPLGLFTTALVVRFVEQGGFGRWCAAAAGSAALVLVHITAPLVAAPAAALAYLAAVRARRRGGGAWPRSRHAGVWMVPVLVFAVGAFWWLPGLWLAATKGASDIAFVHPEPMLGRLWFVVIGEAPIMVLLWGGGLLGLVALASRRPVAAVALGTYMAAGFFWGYLAGPFRAFDLLQPGRQTYAFYTGAALATGIGIAEAGTRLRRVSPDRLDLWAALALALFVLRAVGPGAGGVLGEKLKGPEPFLASRPTSQLKWIVENVKQYMPPGSRLLYEEGGMATPEVPDPFQGKRYSGVLPHLAHVEVLGGPFLHVTQQTNFTQFGEGRLFGKARWDRAHFERYARLYRPSAIACWSPYARGFCRSHPDLIDVLEDNGFFLLGKVKGYAGAAIEGAAQVEAVPGRLRVRGLVPGPDGSVTLRYHAVPCLRTVPPVPWEPVFLEEDPVPFIKLRAPADAVSVEIHFPPPEPDRATRAPH